jgi:plasmid maintenance system antidote protein VapI
MIARIKKVIESSNLTDSGFAARCGLVQSSLWLQLNGKRKLSLDTVLSVLKAFPEISPAWLLLGEGEMLNEQMDEKQKKRIDGLLDVVAMQQETIRNLMDKIKQLQNS